MRIYTYYNIRVIALFATTRRDTATHSIILRITRKLTLIVFPGFTIDHTRHIIVTASKLLGKLDTTGIRSICVMSVTSAMVVDGGGGVGGDDDRWRRQDG